ncbi:hypothetical protein [uncultured Duncaniella sp.]|uniref:hypothetical protein n=1 Tax=uncultured Duncaniella sp. TaxID=2768039 RepID=UPI0026EBC4D1|nr:hypothetical protein [uncultured Duncaniella sp.]
MRISSELKISGWYGLLYASSSPKDEWAFGGVLPICFIMVSDSPTVTAQVLSGSIEL